MAIGDTGGARWNGPHSADTADGGNTMATGGVVKSAGRVMEVLELFAAERTPLVASEIARRLDWPKSSTNVLLRSLVSMGYLMVDVETIEYFPTPRITGLGDWIPDALRAGDDAIRCLEELHDRTGETVTLSIQNAFDMQFVVVLPGTFPISLTMREGFTASIFTTAVGTALLTEETDDTVRRLAQRANHRRRNDGGRRVDVGKLLAEVRAARERGYAVGYERVFPDTGALGMAVRSRTGGRTLVVGVGGLAARIRRNEAQIVDAMRKCFGKTRVPLKISNGRLPRATVRRKIG
jgi:DNA-binding IclR family transcriptional regulator